MLKNYFATIIRIIRRSPFFSSINILGFSIGLTASLLIFIYIHYELSFDKDLSNYENIYWLMEKEIQDDGVNYTGNLPYPLGRVLEENLPEGIEPVHIYLSDEIMVASEDKKFQQENLLFTFPNFISTFDVKVLEGNPERLNEPNTVFISPELKELYFGDANAIGKSLNFRNKLEVEVAGIIEPAKGNTNVPYEMIASMESLTDDFLGFEFDRWSVQISGFGNFLKMPENSNIKQQEKLINKIYKANNTNLDEPNKSFLQLYHISKRHLDTRIETIGTTYSTGMKFIWIFILAGTLLLSVAVINFINLSTVQAIKRSKEVGIRKVSGATRNKLIQQFIGEAAFIVFISLVISLILTEISLPKLNEIFEHSIELKLYRNYAAMLFLIVVAVGVTILSGTYPAFFLSRYNPIRALRNQKGGVSRGKKISLQQILVFAQFFIAQILIISTIIILQQTRFILNKDLGFASEKKLDIILYDIDEAQKKETYKKELEQIAGVKNVTLCLGAPISNSNINSSFTIPEIQEEPFFGNIKPVDENYRKTFDLKMISGNWIRNNYNPGDTIVDIVINEQLLRETSLGTPAEAIGKQIQFWTFTGTIRGVTENFHMASLHESIRPVIFFDFPDFQFRATIHYTGESMKEVDSRARDIWEDFFPDYLYQSMSYDDFLDEMYVVENRTADILQIFTILAIILASLGLMGLTSYILVQRTKEIGVRKALGATVSSIVILLSTRFMRVILISGVLAWPVAWYLMKNWMQDFQYHIQIHIGYFLAGTFILVFIALLFIITKTVRAARQNPVKSLRYE